MNPGPFCPNAAFRRSPVRFDVIIANFRAYSKRIPCVAGGSSPCPPYPAGRLRGERLGQIENRPATMTRLERPFGIHLILATQRPDINVFPARSRATWISEDAAGRTAFSLKSSWTTPVPPTRYPRTQGAASLPGMGRCSSAPCLMTGSFKTGGGSHGAEEENQRLRHREYPPMR